MKEYTKQMLLFTEIFGKRVEVDFDGGEMASDAGILFLRETENRVGILNRLANVIHDRRHPSYVKHEIHQLLTQRVNQIALGYEDANDCDSLRTDPILKLSCNELPLSGMSLASQSTMSRFENSCSRTTLYRMSQAFLEAFIDSYVEPPEGIILDFDDTVDPTHGAQQMSLFNSYHNTTCYMPLHVYEGQSGKLITTILRSGKRPSGKEIVSYLKRIVKMIRSAWPHVGIIFRGDSHYSTPEVHDCCKENNIIFVLGQTAHNTLKEKASKLIEKAKKLYSLKKEPIILYGECLYQADSWSIKRRIIFKVEYNEHGANMRFIVTNLRHTRRRFIYETIYCGRGTMENYIKEHKLHLFSGRTSCHTFVANQFRLFLHSAAYFLLHAFRGIHLKYTEFANAQFDTIRLKLLKIGAQVRELKTRVKIHLPSSFPLHHVFITIWKSCCVSGYA